MTGPPLDGGAESSAWQVKLPQFEGPLDLLLHLVRANDVQITDIPIVRITEQYNRYLELMRELDLEVAGEYIVVAATLMHIKSRMLLPPDPELPGESGPADPRDELVRQLLDYQRLRQATESIEALDGRRSLVFIRASVPQEFRDEELLQVGLFDLLRAFQGLVQRLNEESRLRLKRDTVSVAEKIAWLGELLERRSSIDLLELLADLATPLDRIATFLAVLELMRMQRIVAFQRRLFGEIRIAAGRAAAAEATEGSR